MSSQLETIKGKPKFSVAIQTTTYKDLINRTLGDAERAKRFIASISSAVAMCIDINIALDKFIKKGGE